jgi:hypothetical protein
MAIPIYEENHGGTERRRATEFEVFDSAPSSGEPTRPKDSAAVVSTDVGQKVSLPADVPTIREIDSKGNVVKIYTPRQLKESLDL